MQTAHRPLGRSFLQFTVILLALLTALPALAAEKQRIQVDDYLIDARLEPETHKLSAQAKVKFTAIDDITTATFELHNGLRLTKVIDATGKLLSAERVTQDSTVRLALPAGLQKGQTTTLTFDYEGILNDADDSPVPGLLVAKVAPDTSYLLYAGRWSPVVGYGTNRFTATISVTVPAGYTVVGSGKETAGKPVAAAAIPTPPVEPRKRTGRRKLEPAPATPAAGPESIVSIGLFLTSSIVITPPSHLIIMRGVLIPAFLTLPSVILAVSIIFGTMLPFITAVRVLVLSP
jgi:hypothetical protein